jgi:oligopeptide transport system substrate-binding protein
LRIGIERPKSFDPALASPGSQSELIVADLLFDGLTAEPAGASAPEPALAASWKPSGDLKAWTFTLRSGATFANGRAINALDVKYSLERVAKQGEASLSAVRLEHVLGWRDLVAGTADGLAGVKAIDATTVEVDLDVSMAALPELLSSPVYGIVAKESVESGPTWASAPIGSGPFAYASVAADVVTLKRAPSAATFLDGVELHLYDDAGKAYGDFAAGNLDWSPVPTAKATEAIGRFGGDAFRPFQAEVFFAFNLLDPTLADARFRQAIVKAVDRAAIVKAVYPGVAIALDGLVPDGVPGHVADACGQVCSYDPATAQALLTQAFPDGVIPTVHIDYATSPTADAVAAAIQAGLTAVGIPSEERPKAAADYDTFATSGQVGLFQLGWVGLYPDADGYLVPLFTGGSRDNATGFASPEIDAQLATARATTDPVARLAAFQKAEQTILSYLPIVPIAQLLTKAVVSSRVHDLSTSVGGTFEADKVWLTP